MKHKLLILFSLLAVLIVSAACSKDEDSDIPLYQSDVIEYDANRKILVAYFSWGGNTQNMAENIAGLTDATLFRIETVTPYPTDYNECTEVAREELDNGILPELNGAIDNLDEYDVILSAVPFGGTQHLWPYGHFWKVVNTISQTKSSYRSVRMHQPIGRKHLPK